MNTCPDCGGELIGDGYTVVIHCENTEEAVYQYAAPDEGPIACEQSASPEPNIFALPTHTTHGENVVSHGEIIYTGPKAAQFAAALDEINRLEAVLHLARREANNIHNEAFTHQL